MKKVVQGLGKVRTWDIIRVADDPVLAARSTDVIELEIVSKYYDDVIAEGGYAIWSNKALLNADNLLIGKFVRGESLELIDGITLHGGNTIALASGKTTTITGVLDDVNTVPRRGVNPDGSFNGITAANVSNVGGINILRSQQWGIIKNKYSSVNSAGETVYDWPKITDEFWNDVNRPWLDDAINRDDNIRLVSDSGNPKKYYVTDATGDFVLDPNGDKIISIFGREVNHLESQGYTILSDGTAVK